MTSEHSNTQLAAVLWVTLSTGLFSLTFVSGRLAPPEVMALHILFLRYIGGFAVVGTLVAMRRQPVGRTRPARVATHALRTMCGASGGICAIEAAARMPIADATAIGMLDGLLIVLLGIVLLREVVSGRHWLAIAVSIVGGAVVVAGRGAFAELDAAYAVPAGLAFAGAVLIALESILIRVLAVSEPLLNVLFFVNLFGMLLLAGPALATWPDIGAAGPGGADPAILGFLILGPISISGQYCTLRGYRLAPVSVVGPVGYSWIVFAALIGLIGFAELPTATTVAGSVLIVAGGVMLARLPGTPAAAPLPPPAADAAPAEAET
ncbi:MAG: DMT family transporter [Rhodospirillaceae bacterium]|nr:DMT family transporter [Rhodospirillaceae bacterium]